LNRRTPSSSGGEVERFVVVVCVEIERHAEFAARRAAERITGHPTPYLFGHANFGRFPSGVCGERAYRCRGAFVVAGPDRCEIEGVFDAARRFTAFPASDPAFVAGRRCFDAPGQAAGHSRCNGDPAGPACALGIAVRGQCSGSLECGRGDRAFDSRGCAVRVEGACDFAFTAGHGPERTHHRDFACVGALDERSAGRKDGSCGMTGAAVAVDAMAKAAKAAIAMQAAMSFFDM
jgi:hypothetical protein